LDKEGVTSRIGRDVEEKHRKRTTKSLLKPKEEMGIFGGETHNRGIMNPHKDYILEKKSVMTPVSKIRNDKAGELSFDVNIDEKKIEDLVEDFEEFSDKYLSKTKKERK
jgi:hypothetical protein